MQVVAPVVPLVLSAQERAYLERQVRRRRVARSLSERCRAILRCADGLPSKSVAAELGLHEHTVGKWRRRFLKDRCEQVPAGRLAPGIRHARGMAQHRHHMQHQDLRAKMPRQHRRLMNLIQRSIREIHRQKYLLDIQHRALRLQR